MLSQSDSPNESTNPLSQLAENMFSDNGNIMLAAIVSLILVILFVLLLHVYAKWFLAQVQSQSQARHRRTPVSISGFLGPSNFHNINIENSPISTKGLDSAIVSAIPMFVYETTEAEAEELECVICLSAIEEGEIGRSLPKCGHAFHVECIDMWLSSHCNCPICRAPIVMGGVVHNNSQLGSFDEDDGGDDDTVLEIVIGTPNYEISENDRGNDNYGGVGVNGSVSETSSSLLGYSLKRMLSTKFFCLSM
ncbi:RING-H2 finger protein ATL63-like [Gastrolobium bilobum]|uniref:RING-H2 finger protein ATL63-like n=1 Tax=Gastrolobium bilobum TaxID=150636 RepID=UPI002AAFC676|nr:RING-H2 finger protein ATL63-like [Gastrolobium bilobum]